jgi:membrane protein
VLGYVTQFAGQAAGLGLVGSAVLFATLLSLVMTIDRTLNSIWRVRRPRPWGQQVLIYWAALTLGPLVIAASLSISSYVLSASRGFVSGLPHVALRALDLFELFMLIAGFAALYRYVPNTPVRARHAWAGGIFTALGIELARRLLALYIQAVPTYSMVYGAFATVPILLIWIYLVWLIVLLGAVLTAHLPSLTAGPHRQSEGHGWQFQVAIEVLRALNGARAGTRRGLSVQELSHAVQLSDLQLEPVLQGLTTLGWIGRLEQPDDPAEAPYVLLADVQSTALEPLMRLLLLPSTEATERLWRSGRLSTLYLKDAI